VGNEIEGTIDLMVIQERKETAQRLLNDADGEFVIGSDLKAAEMMCDAAAHAIKAVAEHRGWQCEDLDFRGAMYVGQRIADELDDSTLHLGVTVAQIFHLHADVAHLEDYEIEAYYQDMCRFVQKMLALVE
jgi:hypothetical protein